MEIPREFHTRVKHSSKINKRFVIYTCFILHERHNPNSIFNLIRNSLDSLGNKGFVQ